MCAVNEWIIGNNNDNNDHDENDDNHNNNNNNNSNAQYNNDQEAVAPDVDSVGNLHAYRAKQKKAGVREPGVLFGAPNGPIVIYKKPPNHLIYLMHTTSLTLVLFHPESDLKLIRRAIDNNSKNGELQKIRYYKNVETGMREYTPLNMMGCCCKILTRFHIISLNGYLYKQNWCGGKPCIKGTRMLHKLSEAFGKCETASAKLAMVNFLRKTNKSLHHPGPEYGVDWSAFTCRSNDHHNVEVLELLDVGHRIDPSVTLQDALGAHQLQQLSVLIDSFNINGDEIGLREFDNIN